MQGRDDDQYWYNHHNAPHQPQPQRQPYYSDMELLPPNIPGVHAPRFSTGSRGSADDTSAGAYTPYMDSVNPSQTALVPPSPTTGHGYEHQRLVANDKEDMMYGGPRAGSGAGNLYPVLGAGAAGGGGVGGRGGAGGGRYVPSSAHNGYNKSRRKKRLIGCTLFVLLILIVAAAVVIPIYFKVIKPNMDKNAAATNGTSGSTNGDTSSNPSSPIGALSGGDGSTIIDGSGTSFQYSNSFGGLWYYDPTNPFTNNAQAQRDTPPLNQSWTFGKDQIRGVNIGGWFVLEPFISPALFQKYPDSVDEWTLAQAMRADTGPNGGIQQLETHYQTFITEEDFAQIAGAGLNWIRLPIPYWAIEVWPGEPFLEKTAWKYILQAFQWARKYGLRIYLDLHTAPGSQNGYNHSGKGGQINFLNGPMGIANAQRMMGYVRIITEFISQPEWKDVIPVFGMINEARVAVIGKEQITDFYLETHDMIRGITGTGAGNGPFMTVHDGFLGIQNWTDFLRGADRIALDTHPYFAFDGQANNEPLPAQAQKACGAWAGDFNTSQQTFGVTLAGEWSSGFNDCGLYLLGVGNSATSYEKHGGNCTDWTVWEAWDATKKEGLKQFALASMDALSGSWFYWTWKIGNDTQSNSPRSPLWSYQLGLQNGWMPTDPRQSVGKCASIGTPPNNVFNGNYQPWQTGGAGAGTIDANSRASFGHWPPTTINNVPSNVPANLLPTYTSTGAVSTLPPPTLTYVVKGATKTVDAGNGWFATQDTGGAATPVSGCNYLDPWTALSSPVPAACPSSAAKKRVAEALITTAPVI